MEPFDPLQFNFALLRDLEFPGGVAVYEYRNHPAVSGERDYLRLNLYLSKDGDFVNVWWGLVEPMGTKMEFTTGRLKAVERQEDLELYRSYNEDLFRGYIDTAEAAAHVSKALRIGTGRAYAYPQVLSAGRDNELRCETMEEAVS